MNTTTDELRTARIRDLKDAFRRSFTGGQVLLTAGVDVLRLRC
jgi:hypothetical protein